MIYQLVLVPGGGVRAILGVSVGVVGECYRVCEGVVWISTPAVLGIGINLSNGCRVSKLPAG